MIPPEKSALVAGVDGCRSGWICVLWDDEVEARVLSTFAEVLDLEAAIIAVDMPIGLPERLSGKGGREADRQTRARLGGRQSAVFSVPVRAAVMQHDYRAACAENLKRSDPPKKVSKQIFNLFGKIREIDALMTPQLQQRIFEVHPELAFWAMNDGNALDEPKKVKNRPHASGLELRRALLDRAGFPVAHLKHANIPPSDAGPDDILDAAACAWSARRILLGKHIRLPDSPPLDGRGLRMEINA